MGLRELLWALVLVLLAYGGWQFLRALRAARKGPAATAAVPEGRKATPAPVGRAVPAQAAVADEAADAADDGDADDDLDYAPVLRPGVGAPPAAAPVPPAPDAFQLEVEVRRLRRELATLQGVIERQHDEIDGLNLELRSLREQLEQGASTQGNASPEYAEALALAAQGLNADQIAARCGITVAEAELVLSLSAGQGRRR